MKTKEALIHSHSEYFVYLPSIHARNLFFYPLCCGLFSYQKGYHLQRESYDSYLFLYIKNGSMSIYTNETNKIAGPGDLVFLDCYQPHAYTALEDCETIWCHFDSSSCAAHYQSIISRLGNVISLPDSSLVFSSLMMIYHTFSEAQAVKEAALSCMLYEILTALHLYTPASTEKPPAKRMDELLAYISEHMSEPISVEQLAQKANMSLYHFIRIFRRETGFTPHEYLLHLRISTARYLLKNTQMPVKEICFQCGFSCESVFCNAFRRHTGTTPLGYRQTSKNNDMIETGD